MSECTSQRCFLLTHSFHDASSSCTIDLFAKNETGSPVHITVTNFRPPFFVPCSTPSGLTRAAAERKTVPMKTFDGIPVDCLYFTSQSALLDCAGFLRQKSVPVFESDIYPVDRFLMERRVKGGFEAAGRTEMERKTIRMIDPHIRGADVRPALKVLSLDIETNVRQGTIYSIACSGKTDRVFLAAAGKDRQPLVFCGSERNVLQRFLDHIAGEDPDVIIGWNVIEFDLTMISERCRSHGIPFFLGRSNTPDSVFTSSASQRTRARISGRAVIDLPVFLRAYHDHFEEYSLDHVAHKVLNRRKSITLTGEEKIAAIDNLFMTDKNAFAQYNLQDALLTRDIFETVNILPNAMERTLLSGHLLERTGGSIASFDFLYLPLLHRTGYVAPDAKDHSAAETSLPGGYVIEPDPGIYDNVLILDFRSLYPSIIMSFMIDPLGRHIRSDEQVQGPCGPPFSRSPSILPGIISDLLEARETAKQENNPYLSRAIKLLMNSFYGVLGARTCRFFSVELASAITGIGQYILKETIRYITTSTPFRIIYGDTDSLFVLLGKSEGQNAEQIGRTLALKSTEWLKKHLRDTFDTESALLLQFETHYRHFLIPAVRGTSQGSKKHYCGGNRIHNDLELTFKGMESARSDWTDIAKELQGNLIRRVFSGRDVETCIHNTVNRVLQGREDSKLVYRKRLRKAPEAYTHTIPPHVQAARRLDTPPHTVRYYITVDGPQPVEKHTAPIDYQHYIDCQLQPVADSILELTGKSFSAVLSGQQDLFG